MTVSIANHDEPWEHREVELEQESLAVVTLHAYIEDWSVWFIQQPILHASPNNFRFPPFLDEFRRVDGPYRLGLSVAVDVSRNAGHTLATDGIKLFDRYLDTVADGLDPLRP